MIPGFMPPLANRLVAPGGAFALLDDDFSTDTSGDWYGGSNFVDGTIAVTGGKLVYTVGANCTAYSRIVTAVSGFTIGAEYSLAFVKSGTASGILMGVSTVSNAPSFTDFNAFTPIIFIADATTLYLALQHSADPAVPGHTLELDSILVEAT